MANLADIETALDELQAGPLPLPVAEWRVEAGSDWSADPAVWVWIVLEHDDFKDEDGPTLLELKYLVHSRVKGLIDDDSFLYVRFGEASEPGKAS